jgi:transmembrane sensor
MTAMSTTKNLKYNAQVSEEAAEWLVEFRTGDLDDRNRQAFDAWIRSSQEHLRAFLEIAAIWNEGSSLDPAHTLDLETLIARARTEPAVVSLRATLPVHASTSLKAKMPPAFPRLGQRRYRLGLAASLLLVSALALLAWNPFESGTAYATALGEQRVITLADGSTIDLNSHSRVRVKFTTAARTVQLEEGQALFRVAKNPSRPFIVKSGEAQVRAVGTQFDVDRTPSATIVTVLEGRVAVTGAPGRESGTRDPGIFLAAGEQVTVAPRITARPVPANVSAATAWTHNEVVLESAPLSEVADAFNKYSSRRLIAEDSITPQLLLSGRFTTDPNFIIQYLKARPDISVVESDREIRIIRRRTD